MTNNYLALAQLGRNQWWRYLVAILLILFAWFIIGSIPTIVLATVLVSDNNPATQLNPQTTQFEGIPPLLPYIVLNFTFISFLLGLYLAVRLLHHRPVVSLVTPYNQVNWRRVFQGFGVYFLLTAIFTIVEAVLVPGAYQLTFNPNQFPIFLPIALVMTSIQTSTEELFFRGYVMQGIGLRTRNRVVVILVSSLLFMLPHLLNPEVKSGLFLLASFYFLFGVFLAFITIRDNTLELALGAHTANNLFIVLIANFKNSALPSPSIFTAEELNPVSNLIGFIAISVIFCLILLRKRRTIEPLAMQPDSSSHQSSIKR